MPDLHDLFFPELAYDSQIYGMAGDTLQKNGNIAAMYWEVGGRDRQAYGFRYDGLDPSVQVFRIF